jgi:hypothetical protein
VKVGLKEGAGSEMVRLMKYEEGGRAKDHLGGYENKNSLYLPVEREITKKKIEQAKKN